MGNRKEDERRLAQLSPRSLEEARIFKLDPPTVIFGFNMLLDEKYLPIVNQIKSDEPTEEEKWIIMSLECVASFIAPDNSEIWLGFGAYKEVVIKTLRYMRFFGFSDEELSAQGISSANERSQAETGLKDEKWEKETGLVDLRSRAFRRAFERLTEAIGEKDPAKVQMQREISRRKVQGETIAQYLESNLDESNRETLGILDALMKDYDRCPPHEEFLAWAEKKKIPEYLFL